jgi:hypothetical protein
LVDGPACTGMSIATHGTDVVMVGANVSAVTESTCW